MLVEYHNDTIESSTTTVLEIGNDSVVKNDDFYADVYRVFKECEQPTTTTPEWFHQNMSSLINNHKHRQHHANTSTTSTANNSSNGIRVLSVGCGNGIIDSEIMKFIANEYKNCQYVGIDTNSIHIDQAKVKMDRISGLSYQFINSPIEDFLMNKNNKEEPFDLIIAIHSFYYIPDRKTIIDKLIRNCLKQDGKLVIVHQSPEGINRFQRLTNHIFVDSTLSLVSSTTNVQLNSIGIEDMLIELNLPYSVQLSNVVVDSTESIVSKPISTNGLKLLSFFLERDLRIESEKTIDLLVGILKSICTFRKSDQRYLMFHPDVFITIQKTTTTQPYINDTNIGC